MSSSFEHLPPYQSVPYHLASQALQAAAVSIVQNVFQQDFPTLTSRQWPHVVATCYPVLEVGESNVEIRKEDLSRLTTYLYVMHTNVASPLSLAYCPVAHKLNGVFKRASRALTQGSALPASQQHEAIELYRFALEGMISGDAVADNICLAFAFRDPNWAPPRRVYVQSIAMEAVEPTVSVASPSRNQRSIQELPEQWDHLQAWFKQTNDSARPWSVSGIARQLKLTQPLVRALLLAPKGTPGFSRTAFTKVRLRRLQRYFKPYGYKIS
ncbi:hypothetical protein [Hymenobacter profundi]|uniref:ER-bound oxygenase mpaB/mpaB'/Rubber oxygenase catalytic domain-containing protein n=1 Tax=Hymenobacter profundi TaxID=1982110 RepID=A0ABS6WVT5_9BACT|nr:hypothetical protein [Hymenobacter profundi]MBW3127715.1 hypothetical protein [Hymenobacter profundi]